MENTNSNNVESQAEKVVEDNGQIKQAVESAESANVDQEKKEE